MQTVVEDLSALNGGSTKASGRSSQPATYDEAKIRPNPAAVSQNQDFDDF
jgi:hypothetical protein